MAERKKPRGKQGRFVVKIVDGVPAGDFVPDPIGDTKTEIENAVLQCFVASLGLNGGKIYAHRQNAEQDIDFTVQAPGGKVHLELTEVVPAHSPKERPFDAPNRVQTFGEAADRIVAAVRAKDKYKPNPAEPVHLVAYCTDYRVSAPQEVVACARIELNRFPLRSLQHVVWVEPFRPVERSFRVLYPFNTSIYPPEDLERIRAIRYLPVDPSAASLRGVLNGAKIRE